MYVNPSIPDQALNEIRKHLKEVSAEISLREKITGEDRRTEKHLNDQIEKLKTEASRWEEQYLKAVKENARKAKAHPKERLFKDEGKALQNGFLENAAEIREQYYRQLKSEKNSELAAEAVKAAERWENAFKLSKALELYREAFELWPENFKAGIKTLRLQLKLGNSEGAFDTLNTLKKNADSETPPGNLWRLFAEEGDLLILRGKRKEALSSHQQALKIAEKIAAENPENAEWQIVLSINHEKIGGLLASEGSRGEALEALRKSLRIRKKLAADNPENAEWQVALAVNYYNLGLFETSQKEELFSRALEIFKRLDGQNKLTHDRREWIEKIENKLK